MQKFYDFELKNYTSFKIGGKARCVYFPESVDEFAELLSLLENPLVFGGMSNVLISSSGIEQNVILTKKLSKFEFQDTTLIAEAGVMGPLVSKAAAKNSLSGMEFMCGFPGTIGGIVWMNAGAHSQTISDVFVSARIFDCDNKKIVTLFKEDMKFDYRNSILQSRNGIVLDAKFELKNGTKEDIEAKMLVNTEFRKNRQPNLSKPNCGSVFKNPLTCSAGKLLEDAGAKSLCVGGAKVFENHANFIINYSNASSLDVLQLMKKMYNSVYKKFGVKLCPEVKFFGNMNKEEEEIWKLLNEK